MHSSPISEMEHRATTLAKLERLYALLGRAFVDYQVKLGRLKEKAHEVKLDFVGDQSVHVRTTTLDRREQ